VRLRCYLGGDAFRDFIQSLVGKDRVLSQEIVGRKHWRRQAPMAAVLSAIAEARGVSVELLRERRWHHAERDLAMYLCREVGEKSLKEIGASFGIGAAAVGHAVSRAKAGVAANKALGAEAARARSAIARRLET
jgi:chromosomal replication initiation ATPase DnaA